MHRVVVLVVDGVIAFDAMTPVEVLGRAQTPQGAPAYQVRFAGPSTQAKSGPTVLAVPYTLDELANADTIFIPGREDPEAPLPSDVVPALRRAAARGVRLASICVGALDLAATGLLDGLRATTHWRAAGLLGRLHPRVDVDASALFVDNGQILCSAGAAAGIDLCLHLVAIDHGATSAADAARITVVPLTRDGDQSQYIRDDTLGTSTLTEALAWIEKHSAEQITVEDIAKSARVSARTLHRRFVNETGLTPSMWLARTRVRHAQQLLESTELPIDHIAATVGLGSGANFRTRFTDIVGITPSRYRQSTTLARM